MNILGKLLLLLTKLFYLHIGSTTISCPPLSIFCTFILLSQLLTSPEILTYGFHSCLPQAAEAGRKRWQTAGFMSHAVPGAAYKSALNQDGGGTAFPYLSGAQRSSGDSFPLLTDTPGQMLLLGEAHLPKYLLPSILD